MEALRVPSRRFCYEVGESRRGVKGSSAADRFLSLFDLERAMCEIRASIWLATRRGWSATFFVSDKIMDYLHSSLKTPCPCLHYQIYSSVVPLFRLVRRDSVCTQLHTPKDPGEASIPSHRWHAGCVLNSIEIGGRGLELISRVKTGCIYNDNFQVEPHRQHPEGPDDITDISPVIRRSD